MKKSTVIFDMDGVLVDTEQIYYRNLKSTLQQYGCEIEESFALSLCGKSVMEKLEILSARFSIHGDLEEIASVYRHRLENFPDCSALVFPHVKETLQVMTDAGYRIGLASNSNRKRIEKVLGDCDLKRWFSHISSGYELGVTKPDPGVYLDTVGAFGAAPEECMAVEDSASGILAAKAAGLFTAAKRDLRFGFDQRMADIQIDDLRELLDIL